jgi:transcriptional regulator with XRE-family HTH domain
MSQQEHVINGELLRLRREERGWVLSDMALRSCMSVKQIRQLEEGGTSAFYSEAVKLTAAKKAASVLGLSEQEVFAHEAQVSEVQQQVEHVEHVEPTAEAVAPVQTTHETEPESEPQPVEPERNHAASPAVAPSTSEATRSSAVDAAKPKTSLWTIVGLFFFALAVAAYLQPQDEEATEAAPPLQAVPEAEAAASSAEPVASAASAAADTPASGVQKPVVAALPATPASTIAPARTSASASGAASAASSIQMPTPAASRAP